MIQTWASMKSFKLIKPIDDEPPLPSSGRNAETDLRDATRTNATHASTIDPEAKLYRKGAGMEARLAFLGHALMGDPLRARGGCLPDPSERPRRAGDD